MITMGRILMLAALAGGLPATAQAATTPVTVGSSLASSPSTNFPGCAGTIECVFYQTNAATPVAVAPADGVVTSWKIKAGSSGSPVSLRVLHPGTGGSYTAAGTSTTETTSGGANADNFTTSLPVSKGDVLAVANSSSALLFATAPAAFVAYAFQAQASNTPVLPDGTTGTPNLSQSSIELMMNATILPDEADVSIAKSASPDPVGVGQDLTYLLTVKNNGSRPSKGNTVSDTLPVGVTLKSVTPSAGTCSNGPPVACDLGTLAPGASETIAIKVSADAAGTLSNTATVSSTTPDPTSGNNSSTITTTVTAKAQPTPPPTIRALKLSPARFRLGSFLPTAAAAKKPPVGTKISYVVTGASTVTLRFQQLRKGKRPRAAGSISRKAVTGINRVRFSGRLSGKRKLKPGRYRVTAVAKAGNLKSKSVQKTFTLLKH
ncbi:MAG: hypothetical protein QOG68_2166 [Solirubrobacteraceae bacterium]|nr:hypothetical protein [Solirubrobacteraceae bacterium]